MSNMGCPRCQGFVVRERYGFLWLTWLRCINCGWHGGWKGRDPERLSDELERLVKEVETEAARANRKKTSRLAGYQF